MDNLRDYDTEWRKVQSKVSFEYYYHNLNVKDKVINGNFFLYAKRNINDKGNVWLDRQYIKFV